ncbi:hypothetical protein CPB85DRAFT_1433245 [Mucidula mucida]|nr:hypothetical protein CPB85DRAFT_1433245 [Mucidula mucida]
MLILFARDEFIAAEPIDDGAERLLKRSEAPLSEWFDSFLSWETLADKKHVFFTVARGSSDSLHMKNILSSSFQGFKPWISRLKDALEDGLGRPQRGCTGGGQSNGQR